MTPAETQPQSASRIYNARSANYDDSWHPDYSRRLVEHVSVSPGMRVLVLRSGTGLESFLAAKAAGPGGLIVGVDISEGMLQQARARQEREAVELGRAPIRFVHHDVTNLDASAELREFRGSFDLLICSNAFVLLGSPAEVVRRWRPWLKQGGRMVVDIPHERNFIQGRLIEEVAKEMELSWPSNRSWVRDRGSLVEVLESENVAVESTYLMEKATGQSVLSYDVDQADEQFDYIIKSPFAYCVGWTETEKSQAKDMFREKWKSIAADGQVEIVDTLYVYIAKKT